jgi:hypothetical protein
VIVLTTSVDAATPPWEETLLWSATRNDSSFEDILICGHESIVVSVSDLYSVYVYPDESELIVWSQVRPALSIQEVLKQAIGRNVTNNNDASFGIFF